MFNVLNVNMMLALTVLFLATGTAVLLFLAMMILVKCVTLQSLMCEITGIYSHSGS